MLIFHLVSHGFCKMEEFTILVEALIFPDTLVAQGRVVETTLLPEGALPVSQPVPASRWVSELAGFIIWASTPLVHWADADLCGVFTGIITAVSVRISVNLSDYGFWRAWGIFWAFRVMLTEVLLVLICLQFRGSWWHCFNRRLFHFGCVYGDFYIFFILVVTMAAGTYKLHRFLLVFIEGIEESMYCLKTWSVATLVANETSE